MIMPKFIKAIEALIAGGFFIFIGYYLYYYSSSLQFINLGDPKVEMQKLQNKHDWQTLKLYTNFVLSNPLFSDSTKLLAQKYHDEANSHLNSTMHKIKDCLKGVFTGEVNDAYSLGCTTVSDLTIFGDLRDIVIQGWNLITGQKANKLVLGLSGIGLLTDEIPGFDVGDSLLKSFAKVGAISKRFAETIKRLVTAKDVDGLKPIFADSDSLVHAYDRYGFIPLAKVYKYVDDTKELDNLTKLSKDIGPETTYVLVRATDGGIIKDYEIADAKMLPEGVIAIKTADGKSKMIGFISSSFSKLNLIKVALKEYARGGLNILIPYLKEWMGKYFLILPILAFIIGLGLMVYGISYFSTYFTKVFRR